MCLVARSCRLLTGPRQLSLSPFFQGGQTSGLRPEKADRHKQRSALQILEVELRSQLNHAGRETLNATADHSVGG